MDVLGLVLKIPLEARLGVRLLVSTSKGMSCASRMQGYISPFSLLFLSLVFTFFILFFPWELKGELYLYCKYALGN